MVTNFRARGISRDTRKLAQTLTLHYTIKQFYRWINSVGVRHTIHR
jgi:hypothetical protein